MWEWNRQMCEKSKGTTKCEKRIVTCDIATAQYKHGTLKCKKKVAWCNRLPTSGYHTLLFWGGTVELLIISHKYNILVLLSHLVVPLLFFSHLTVPSSHCAVPTSNLIVLFSHLVVPLFLSHIRRLYYHIVYFQNHIW